MQPKKCESDTGVSTQSLRGCTIYLIEFWSPDPSSTEDRGP